METGLNDHDLGLSRFGVAGRKVGDVQKAPVKTGMK